MNHTDSTPACVLIVDDEPDLCELLAITLDGMGLASRSAGSLAQAPLFAKATAVPAAAPPPVPMARPVESTAVPEVSVRIVIFNIAFLAPVVIEKVLGPAISTLSL